MVFKIHVCKNLYYVIKVPTKLEELQQKHLCYKRTNEKGPVYLLLRHLLVTISGLALGQLVSMTTVPGVITA